MTNVCVGLRSDASIDVDMKDEEEDGWNFNTLSVEEAEFLRDELSGAIDRAKARKAVLDARNPPASPPSPPVSDGVPHRTA